MKKIFALLLVLFLMLPLIFACGKKGEPEDESSSESSSETSTATESSSKKPAHTGDIRDRNDYIDTKTEDLDTWEGKTLNILATKWHSDLAPLAPWAVAELCATEKDGDGGGYGKIINNAILERNQLVLDTYGVTLNWIEAPAGILSLLNVESTTPNSDYHIAYPRMFEAQTLVMNGVVLDMSLSKYIDFRKDYFNQMSYESYTIADHTFFVSGDFSFLDEQTSFMIFFNKILAAENADFPDVYKMVRNGTWTADAMYDLAAAVGADADGNGVWDDNDIYGFSTTAFDRFFQYFGIQQVSVDKDTQEYYVSLNDDRVSSVIDSIIYCMNSTWSTSSLKNASQVFVNNRLLFYNQAFQTIDHFGGQYKEGVFEFGLLPFPKLNEGDDYYTPVSYQSCLICIPKSAYWADGGKLMAEYFVDVLSWTGEEYIMGAYLRNIEPTLADPDSIEMLEEYIFPNMMYDQGYMYSWDGLLTKNVQIASYSNGTNKFEENYAQNEFAAMTTVADWNTAWGGYDEDDYKNP